MFNENVAIINQHNSIKTEFHRNGTFGDNQLEFPGRTKLGTQLLKNK